MRCHVLCWSVVAALSWPLAASEIVLHQVTYPERRSVDLVFTADSRAPRASVEARVEHSQGQAAIDLRYRGMKPAILFGADVTCFVLWAVMQDGTAENLGEVMVTQDNDSLGFSTGLKRFALLITAETHPLVAGPSSLVMFTSGAPDARRAPSEAFTFSDLGPAPETVQSSLAVVTWNRDFNVEVRQAERLLELARLDGAEEHAATQLRRAQTTLAQARNLAEGKKSKTASDYARRTVALAAEALQVSERHRQAEALAAEIAARQAEMAALEGRAAEAEAAAEAALAEIERQQAEAEAALASATAETARQQAEAEAALASAAAEKAMLDEQVASLRGEREELSSRLAGALSKVAETQTSARGMIVNLPDILFDSNEATLKGEARQVIAKLAGILLIMEELNLRVEGHTDSTGSADYNQVLSERRAMSVRDFLAQQGIDLSRMIAVGYGLTRPVADNSTAGGRAKNRRVEIVIAEGVVAAE